MGNRFKRKVANQKKKQSEAKRALEMVANACQWLEGFGQELNERMTATMLLQELVFDHIGMSAETVKEKLKEKKAVYEERRKAAEAEEEAKRAEVEANRLANMTDEEKAKAAEDAEIAEHNAKIDAARAISETGKDNAEGEQATETGPA